MNMPFLNTSAHADQLTGNLSYLYLLYLITAPPFLLPTKPTMPEFLAVAGQSISLPCKGLDSKPKDTPTVIVWFLGESRKPIYALDARKSPLKSAKHFPSREYVSRSYFNVSSQPPSLLIDPVQPSDDGVYKCQIEFRKSSTIHHSCRLYVIVPPKEVAITDQDGQRLNGVIGPYDENSDVNFNCEAIGGHPLASATWWRTSKLINGSYEKIGENRTRSQLFITNLQRRDLFVTYTCIGSNNNITLPETSSITIDLNLKPLDVRITSSHEPLYAESKVQVVCESYGGRPNTLLTWWLDGARITSDYKRDIFENFTRSTISIFPTSDDNGKILLCLAVNPLFPRAKIDYGWRLVVFYIPRVKLRFGPKIQPNSIRENTDVYLECIVSANPPADDIRWYFEGNIFYTNLTLGIIQSNQTLVLQNIKKKWTGRYTCEASNSIGTTSSPEIMIRVKYSPSCTVAPNPVAVDIGKMTNVTCLADAHPPEVSFRWMFSDGTNQTSLSSARVNKFESSVSFISTAEHVNGIISCWASNAVGEQRTPCTMAIYEAAPPDPIENCLASNQTESSVQIDCQPPMDRGLQNVFHLEVYDSNLEHLLLNITTNHTPSFLVPNLDFSSTYVIVLYASNSKGRSTTVTVIANPSPYLKGMLSFQEGMQSDDRESIAARPIFFVPLSLAILVLTGVPLAAFFFRKRRKNRETNFSMNKNIWEAAIGEKVRNDEPMINPDDKQDARHDSNPDVIQNVPCLKNDLTGEEEEEKVELKFNFKQVKQHFRYGKKSTNISNTGGKKDKKTENLQLDKRESFL